MLHCQQHLQMPQACITACTNSVALEKRAFACSRSWVIKSAAYASGVSLGEKYYKVLSIALKLIDVSDGCILTELDSKADYEHPTKQSQSRTLAEIFEVCVNEAIG